jgi:DNA polymerase-1
MAKLLIVDGSNLLFQMFFGMPSRIVNKRGKAIHAVLGFVGALLKIIALTKPSHIIAVFDGEHENSRAQISPDYKANRVNYENVPDNENPFSQLEDIYAALNFMQIKHYETDFAEADDDIASYALTYAGETEVVISSQDSDFFQLIGENISVLRYRGDKTVICDTGYILKKYGVLPEQYADFKSLTGDGSDNIKGAEKVGVKTAAMLINQFGNLRNIIKNPNEISRAFIRESIINSAERLQMNYKLIKLSKSELKFGIESCVFSDNNLTTRKVLGEIGLWG